MIIDLPDTTTADVAHKLVNLRESAGALALGRVLTLIIVTEDGTAESAIRAATDASREHPCRIIAVVRGNRRGTARLDAQVRSGGDAGVSEVIVLRLYGPLVEQGDSCVVPFLLPDAPVVAWWPGAPPTRPSEDPTGSMAQRRITDAASTPRPMKTLEHSAKWHVPGDTDLAWSRITLWRGLLAAAFDQPPFEPALSATVTGAVDSPSAELMAAWLALTLRCPVSRTGTAAGTGLISVVIHRDSGPVELVRPAGNVATLTQPGQPDRRVSLAPRSDRDSLAEELRRLDPDEVYAQVLTEGLKLLHDKSAMKAAKSKAAPRADRATPPAPPLPPSPTGDEPPRTPSSTGDEPPPPPSPTGDEPPLAAPEAPAP
ncbi:MAG TPA: glucose-6-phosphate dehydrogenase assembly protein OpcA [Kineosporiaceae bacterium]|nr:glucose-6-phosphate dehydrogenase assembly protein OpcA [Kineosporiaceae bacterium]